MSAAAVFEEEIAQVFHEYGVGPVDELATLALDQQQVGSHQFLEVKAECCLGYGQLLDECRRRQTVPPALNDEAKYIESGLLTQSEKGSDCVGIIHGSNYMEIKMTGV